MARENRFAAKASGVSLSDLTSDVNKKRGHQVTSLTEKHVEDIDINLIDEYDKNELIFGYNNYESVKDSIIKTGNQGVTINVFAKDDGRYLCYSGNTRLRVLREIGEKKITCIIEGPVPDEHELMIKAICGNTQRDFDPYHIACELNAVEQLYREKGLLGEALVNAVAELTGYRGTIQKLYKQILKLDPKLQKLFDSANAPFKPLLKTCKLIPDDKIEKFVSTYNELKKNNTENGDMISKAYSMVMEKEIKDNEKKDSNIKLGKRYKSVLNISFNPDGTYIIPEKKKEEVLEQVKQLEIELQKIKEACE